MEKAVIIDRIKPKHLKMQANAITYKGNELFIRVGVSNALIKREFEDEIHIYPSSASQKELKALEKWYNELVSEGEEYYRLNSFKNISGDVLQYMTISEVILHPIIVENDDICCEICSIKYKPSILSKYAVRFD